MSGLELGLVRGTNLIVDRVSVTSDWKVKFSGPSFPLCLLERIEDVFAFSLGWTSSIVSRVGLPEKGDLEGCGKDSIKFSTAMALMLKQQWLVC